MSTDVDALADLLHEAAETHHRVYRITEGEDPDWASWYADWLIRLSELLGEMERSVKSNVNRPILTEVLALSMNQSLGKILDDIPNRSR